WALISRVASTKASTKSLSSCRDNFCGKLLTSREDCAKVVSSRDDREFKLRVVNMASNRVEDRLLTVADVAEYLGLSVGTVYNKVSRGEIPHVKIGRTLRF